MGYYTHYTLDTDIPVDGPAMKGFNEHVFHMLFTFRYGRDRQKWYRHEEELLSASRAFPGVRFTLKGKGDEPGDVWEKHFVGGKLQVCRAVVAIPPFDPAELE